MNIDHMCSLLIILYFNLYFVVNACFFVAFPAQPGARSTPIHPTQPCRSQPISLLRNGAKSHEHTHTPNTHCPHHTPHLHALQSKPVRNGSTHRHPKLGSLPKGGSSTSSSSSAGHRHNRKLQSNPSITSQSSKRSKSSSKSNSSQIPTDGQDGEIQALMETSWKDRLLKIISKFFLKHLIKNKHLSFWSNQFKKL